jgi:hypothetical protein
MPEVPENVNRLPPELEKYFSSSNSASDVTLTKNNQAKEPANFSSRSGVAWVRQWFPNEQSQPQVPLPESSNNNSDAEPIRAVKKSHQQAANVVSALLRPPPDSSNRKQSSWWRLRSS